MWDWNVKPTPPAIGGGDCVIIENFENMLSKAENVNQENFENKTESTKERGEKMAGWSAGRGKGEYLSTVVILVCALACVIPIVQSMSLTIDQLKSTLDDSLNPLRQDINTFKVQFTSELTSLQSDTDKKFGELSERIQKIEDMRLSSNKPAYNQVASGSNAMPIIAPRPKLTRDEHDKEIAEAQVPTGYRGNRYRHQDHDARMAASNDDRARFELDYAFAYLSIGFYPCGDQEDRDAAKKELEEEGHSKPSENAIEKRCIRMFVMEDMGMTQPVYDELAGDIEEFWFENKTAFCKFVDRRGISTVYHFASCMNKMAKERHVVRKLHLWVPVQLERRFFEIKDLEWNFRDYKKRKGEEVHTRIAFEDMTLVAQWRAGQHDRYQKIREPASQHIAGVEFWRKKSVKALNNRGQRPLPLPRPSNSDVIPAGRKKPSEAYRGRGGGRGGNNAGRGGNIGGRGGSSGGRGGATGGSGGRGGAGSGSNLEPLGPRKTPAKTKETPALNTNAVVRTADANSLSQDEGRSRRGRKAKPVPSQTNTMLGYMSATKNTKRSRSTRRDSSDEELWDENKRGKVYVTPDKDKKKPAKSPEEKKAVNKLVNTLNDSTIQSDKRCKEYAKLTELSKKQMKLYRNTAKDLENGEDINLEQLIELTAAYDEYGNKIYRRLNDLADEPPQAEMGKLMALTYEPDSASSQESSTTDSSLDD